MKFSLKSPGKYFWFSLLICAGYFVLFVYPNHAASENLKMVAIFEPDEYYPVRFVFNMIQPAESIRQAIINFVFYKYYFYGFPYFASSAITLLPLSLLGKLGNTPLIMSSLRQGISVLPMLMSILVLVYLQTEFKSYKSIALLLFLLSIPAVVQNNFWWHPDSLAIFFAMLAIYFLNKDALKFGRNFYLAAVMCAISAATKGIGFYFFLTVFVYLVYGYFKKALPLKTLFLAALGFLACMAAAYFIANPMLVSANTRNAYFSTMQRQSALLSSGYEIIYSKGFLSALPLLTEYYGSILFILVVLLACVMGIVKDKEHQLLNIIILTWLIPISVMVFGLIHFKYQYWLPVALPLISCLVIFLPEGLSLKRSLPGNSPAGYFRFFASVLFLIIVAVQFVQFVTADVQRYVTQLNREKNNPSIQFYSLAEKALEPLSSQDVLVYHDLQLYVPETPKWKTDSTLKLLNYDYITSNGFDVILLMQQRIYDYTNPNVQGIEEGEFALSRRFYQDANDEKLKGYHLIFRNDFGLIYVRDDIHQRYFE